MVSLLAACGGKGSSGTPVATAPSAVPSAAPLPAAPAPRHVMTQDELSFFRPNELGLVPILMYHNITDEPGEWNRSPDQLRNDLEYLYKQGYYLTSMHQYITGNLDIPAGKTPVILTFDDGLLSQFRFLVGTDGELTVDPDCAVGILEAMYYRHPDFGRGAVFYILPRLPFGGDEDTDDDGQYARRKIEFLLDRGYELGNHTLDHADLSQLDDERIKEQIALADDAIHGFAPDYPIESFALPYGLYPPNGDATLLAGFTYQGRTYRHQAALMVGANPAYSPFDARRDLMFLPRIRADDDNLVQWFGDYLQVNYELRYVSDGNPDVVTVPNDLPSDLADQLDPAKVGGRQIVRYDP
jgi:peptidoglycan/xylan/chitin deacetylase (PgdA/CDA1 family)